MRGLCATSFLILPSNLSADLDNRAQFSKLFFSILQVGEIKSKIHFLLEKAELFLTIGREALQRPKYRVFWFIFDLNIIRGPESQEFLQMSI